MFDLADLDICFIAGTLGRGGAERQLFYTLRALQRRGARPRVLSLTQGEFWEERIQTLGVPVVWVGESPSKLLRLVKIIRVLRQAPPAILQSQHFYGNLYAAVAGTLLQVPTIGAVRNDVISEIAGVGAVLGSASLRTPDWVVANSRKAVATAIRRGVEPKHAHFLPNVVDTDLFRRRPRTPNPSVRLLAVGRLTTQKRLDRFLNILSRVRQQSSTPVQGVIVGGGSGAHRRQLERQAAELGLVPEGVEFRGEVAEMTSIYSEADVLVLTSDWEGTPNVILEAMACALPVVATRVGGVEDLVRNGRTGFLADPVDDDTMVAALVRLAGDSRLRSEMGRAARAHALADHSFDRLSNDLAELYGRVLTTGGRTSRFKVALQKTAL